MLSSSSTPPAFTSSATVANVSDSKVPSTAVAKSVNTNANVNNAAKTASNVATSKDSEKAQTKSAPQKQTGSAIASIPCIEDNSVLNVILESVLSGGSDINNYSRAIQAILNMHKIDFKDEKLVTKEISVKSFTEEQNISFNFSLSSAEVCCNLAVALGENRCFSEIEARDTTIYFEVSQAYFSNVLMLEFQRYAQAHPEIMISSSSTPPASTSGVAGANISDAKVPSTAVATNGANANANGNNANTKKSDVENSKHATSAQAKSAPTPTDNKNNGQTSKHQVPNGTIAAIPIIDDETLNAKLCSVFECDLHQAREQAIYAFLEAHKIIPEEKLELINIKVNPHNQDIIFNFSLDIRKAYVLIQALSKHHGVTQVDAETLKTIYIQVQPYYFMATMMEQFEK